MTTAAPILYGPPQPEPHVARYGRLRDGSFGMLPPEEVAETIAALPADAVADLLSILADPKTAKARLDDLADKTAKARAAIAAAKQARADRETAIAEIAAARQAHDEAIASDLARHTTEAERRKLDLDGRERAVYVREKEAADLLEQLKADRVKLDRMLVAVREAAA